MISVLFKKELTATTKLAWPLITALLAQILMELINSMMLGRLGPEALAAGSLGIASFHIFLVISISLFSATGVLIARQFGKGNTQEITEIVNQALYLALMIAFLWVIIMWNIPLFLKWIGEPLEVVVLSAQFLHALVWGLPPLILYFPLRELAVALSHPRIIMFLSLCAAPLTAGLNSLLIYGKWGLPKLGVAGVGYATSITQWFVFLAMLLYIFHNKHLKLYVFHYFDWIRWKKWLEIFRVGAPISINGALEVGLFSISTLMMGYFGAISLASHQIALQCASLAFMFPLGISQATAIRVGMNHGKGSLREAKYAGYAGLILGLFAAVITAAVYLLFPKALVSLFIDPSQPEYQYLVNTAKSFIMVMALFQLLDAVQVIMNGALRGFKDTFFPMVLGFIAYWLIGLSSGYLLAFVLKFNGIGLWWGLGIGVGIAGILLFYRFFKKVQFF